MKPKITRFILDQIKNKAVSKSDAVDLLKELQSADTGGHKPVAVIGIGCKLPTGDGYQEFWTALRSGISHIAPLSGERRKDIEPFLKNPMTADLLLGVRGGQPVAESSWRVGGYLKRIDAFDAAAFRIAPSEAALMEPSQRIILQVAFDAFEDAGFSMRKVKGTRTGVFIGRDHSPMALWPNYNDLQESRDALSATGSWTGVLASRISYCFDLTGPAIVVDTACSSGLVAIHQACRALRGGECGMALAGGIHVSLAPCSSGDESLSLVESPDNRVRPFDQNANGTVWGDGACVFVLKTLEAARRDGDPIHAVILGSAINNDGASNGLTAPRLEAQTDVILRAWDDSGIAPDKLSYIEAHGTGTGIGDPIEIKSLTEAFRKFTAKKQFCGIGSVKSMIGHLVSASGAVSMLKVILASKKKMLPPTLCFEEPNELIDFPESPLYVVDRLTDWNSAEPLLAGVSAFGFSGTNCHVVLQEWREEQPKGKRPVASPANVFPLSARTDALLKETVRAWIAYLDSGPEADFEQLCFSAQMGRSDGHARFAAVAASIDELHAVLKRFVRGESPGGAGVYFSGNASRSSSVNDGGSALRDETRLWAEERLSGNPGKGLELGKEYVNGKEISWRDLYKDPPQVVHVPVTSRDQTRRWFDEDAPRAWARRFSALTAQTDSCKEDEFVPRGLISRRLLGSKDGEYYEVRLSSSKDWVLMDHRIAGKCVVPGTAWLDVACQLGNIYYSWPQVTLQDVSFLSPCVIEEGESRDVQVYVSETATSELSFTVYSRSGSGIWIEHASGKISRCSSDSEVPAAAVGLKRPGGSRKQTAPASVTHGAFTFGPHWDNTGARWQKDGYYISEIFQPADFLSELGQFILHPALMDSACNVFSQDFGESTFLPLHFERIEIFKPLPAHFFTVVKHLSAARNGAIRTFEITAVDDDGKAIFRVEKYHLKRCEEPNMLVAQRTPVSKLRWVRKAGEATKVAPASGTVAAVVGASPAAFKGLKESLSRLGVCVIEVPAHYGPEVQDGEFARAGALLADLIIKGDVSNLIYAEPLTRQDARLTVEDVSRRLRYAMGLMTGFAAEWERRKSQKTLSIAMLTKEGFRIDASDKCHHPDDAVLAAFVQGLEDELSNLGCRRIDIGGVLDWDAVCREIFAVNETFNSALRGRTLFLPELYLSEASSPSVAPVLDKKGIYLVTGGFGGIGLKVAQSLKKWGAVNIALIGRTKPAWLTAGSVADDRMKRFKELSSCCNIEQVYCDISDEPTFRESLDVLRKKYGRVSGVVHCAASLSKKTLLNASLSELMESLRAKVNGTIILDRLTRGDAPGLFVMFSSVASLVGGVGGTDYAAANAFLDAFADYRNSSGGLRTLAFNWPLWKDVGLGKLFPHLETEGTFGAISEVEGLDVFERGIASDEARLVVGRLNAGVSNHYFLTDRFHSQCLAKNIGAERTNAARTVAAVVMNAASLTQIQKKTALLFAEALGLNEIDIDIPLHDLGGDSIVATKIHALLRRDFGNKVSILDLSSNPTVRDVCRIIAPEAGKGEKA